MRHEVSGARGEIFVFDEEDASLFMVRTIEVIGCSPFVYGWVAEEEVRGWCPAYVGA